MPNLVGTGLNQVPTNSMLGGLAYQSPNNASIKDLDLKNLSQINSEIADTAVDIFVYDTSKDSDGGAWRHRTQHTSWYNETLNTATRGSRKEFPSVAVIVAESNKVTIYDGDDPDLPMWMVFTNAGQVILNWATSNAGCLVSAIYSSNGILSIAKSISGVLLFNFVKDDIKLAYDSNTYSLTTGRLITDRNNSNSGGWTTAGDGYTIVNSAVNDVAMTVLPNAPIDDATGLPVPTIAVATDGGISIIKDDGTVASKAVTGGYPNNQIDFLDNGNIVVEQGNSYITVLLDYAADSQSFTSSLLNSEQYTNQNSSWVEMRLPYLTVGGSGVSGNYKLTSFKNNFTSAHSGGLVLVDRNAVSPSNGMTAGISAIYNTGWLHGDCKGAFLSDTDTTNTSELVTNGTFDSDASNWNSGDTSHVTVSQTGGVLQITIASGDDGSRYAYQQINNVPAGTYRVTATSVSNPSNRAILRVGTSDQASSGGGNATNIFNSGYLTGSNVTSTHLFTTTETSNIVISLFNDLVGTGTWDNVKLHLAEEDRSVNNNPLQVFGTITKSAVATGAELVGYSGFNASNNLVQPYNSSLNFGTGDFSAIAWIKKTTLSTNHYIFDRNDGSTENGRLSFMFTSSGVISISTGGGGSQATTTSGIFVGSSNWRMVMVKRTGGVIVFGLDGKEYSSTTVAGNWSTANITGSGDEELTIGQYGGGSNGSKTFNYDYAIDGISNLRISASAPTAEQFKKMYEDEKVLYQENAKCTLYGSSNAITALAYDDKKELLHVGTSSGRSDFQGLRRINNTTTAVTTAISASKGFVAEQ